MSHSSLQHSQPSQADQQRQQNAPANRDRKSADSHDSQPNAPKPLSGRIALILIFIGLGLAVLLAVLGILPRLHARTTLQNQTTALAAPNVLIAKPTTGKTDEELLLPGSLQAYIDSSVYARTSGYLKKWYVDIGAHVHKGQVLAVIESPEVDQQLQQARADLATAQANANNAGVQAARYQSLLKEDAVSRQDTDNFITQQAATNTQVRSAQANVQRLEQLVGFEQLTAPFDGVVTARDIDQGQLIDAGTSREIFHLAQTATLRVYVAVPEVDSLAAKPGVRAQLTLAEYPNQRFDGTIVRTAHAIDAATRTLLVEIDVNNRGGKLMPGAYAEVHMKLNQKGNVMIVPVSTMLFRTEGLRVAVLTTGNKVRLVPITVGRDDGRAVEVVAGLSPDDQVIQNPPDSIIDGELVQPVQPQQQNQQGPGGNKQGGSQ
ncbi:MAG TPA: efflux RND transporter periplasmic adaptor subunit [Acidobacteriaceae bacterium]